MFYVVEKKKRIPITYSNTYSLCPGCGKLHKVDLQSIMQDIEGTDLCDTSVFCEKCTRMRARRHRGEPWADQVLGEVEYDEQH